MVSDTERVETTFRRKPIGKNNLAFLLAGLLLLAIVVIAVLIKASGPSALYPVHANGKYGYMDRSGKLVIQPQFDKAEEFSEGLAPVQAGNRWGYTDKSGKFAIPVQF